MTTTSNTITIARDGFYKVTIYAAEFTVNSWSGSATLRVRVNGSRQNSPSYSYSDAGGRPELIWMKGMQLSAGDVLDLHFEEGGSADTGWVDDMYFTVEEF